VLSGLRPFPVAITTVSQGRANGLMSLSAGSGGIIDEAPRVTISLTKYNFTHDLLVESGVFAMHLLAADPEDALQSSLDIIMGLGGKTGRDGDKMAPFATKAGVTGVPILTDALTRLRAVTRSAYFVQSGLYTGRAGMLLCAEPSAVDTLVRGLCWHAVPYGDGLAFPGNQLLRLSMDFATGTAGVLFALYLHHRRLSAPWAHTVGLATGVLFVLLYFAAVGDRGGWKDRLMFLGRRIGDWVDVAVSGGQVRYLGSAPVDIAGSLHANGAVAREGVDTRHKGGHDG